MINSLFIQPRFPTAPKVLHMNSFGGNRNNLRCMYLQSPGGLHFKEAEYDVAVDAKIREKMKPELLSSSKGIGIVKYLTGKVFFITGATGFLAKVLVEKILRSTPDVSKIYLLIKAKDGDAAMERLKREIIETELFKSMEQLHGKFHLAFLMNKLVPVAGDVSQPGLGLELGVADQIADEVHVIVHSAGNTTFDERYDVALDINTLGPSRILSFAKRCKGLELYLHVSTDLPGVTDNGVHPIIFIEARGCFKALASLVQRFSIVSVHEWFCFHVYTNGQREGIISERQFKVGDSITKEQAALESLAESFPLLDVDAEVEMASRARNVCEDRMTTQKMKHMGLQRARSYGWHDTYVFTKAMGEIVVDSKRDDIPVVIIRPSIIESAYKEPIPGWIEGIRMLDPIILSYGKGELTAFPADANGVIDLVPVDMVVNAMLATMAKHGTIKKPGLNVYHIASSIANPLIYDELVTYFFEYFSSSPYTLRVNKLKLINNMKDYNSHVRSEVVKRSRKLQRSVDIAEHLALIYQPYTFYTGKFDNANTKKLMEELSEEEQRSFAFDVGTIDWHDYLCNIHIPGLLKQVHQGRSRPL